MDSAAKSFSENDKRPLKLYFQDEARFGRMSNPVTCWCPEGFRPFVKMQRVREYIYSYSAVCPSDGDSFSLIMPNVNTDIMTIFLEEFSKCYKDYRIVMVMDGASWHKSDNIKTFENIRTIFQPPYSPEVNPVEHLWKHIREKYLKNHYWDTLDNLINALSDALYEIYLDKETIKSLTSFNWIVI